MQLKKVFLFFLLIAVVSCKSNNDKEVVMVLKTIYERIPKVIPPPPMEIIPDSIKSKIDLNNRKSLTHRYAVNENFQNFNALDISFTGFKERSSPGVFGEHITLTKEESDLVLELNKMKSNSKIDKVLFSQIIQEEVQFINNTHISMEEKKEYDVVGVISFSDVVFNKRGDKAAIIVGTYRGGMDSDLTIYILDRKDEWEITAYNTIEKS